MLLFVKTIGSKKVNKLFYREYQGSLCSNIYEFEMKCKFEDKLVKWTSLSNSAWLNKMEEYQNIPAKNHISSSTDWLTYSLTDLISDSCPSSGGPPHLLLSSVLIHMTSLQICCATLICLKYCFAKSFVQLPCFSKWSFNNFFS